MSTILPKKAMSEEDIKLQYISTAQEVGTRYELRRRYWAFALPYIQQAHDDGTGHGCFSGCTTSKENWLSGFFGIGGFSLACVANYNKARVDLTLAHSNKGRNFMQNGAKSSMMCLFPV